MKARAAGTLMALLGAACSSSHRIQLPAAITDHAWSGSSFYAKASAMHWQQRDSMALDWFNRGQVPRFWRRFPIIKIHGRDSGGRAVSILLRVSPDYLVLGYDADWVRVPTTPMAAQQMMDKVGAVFPTSLIVDSIWSQAKLTLAPLPMVAYRDSGATMYAHHLMIEGQRGGLPGLIAGIKKDVVSSPKLLERSHRVAIYGWHRPDGRPIQPLYVGHVNWYVDYSHGIRFVLNEVRLNGRRLLLTNLLADGRYRHLLSREDSSRYIRY
ncbi:MAG: hypothetical protein MUF62_13405 [Chitinophagaceae bacterium]|nr:hypothetical protein [Chitinophagaceae bacterium]